MDTITQALLGATTAQLGFRQRIGRDAGWVAAAAAVVPDLDIFIAPLLSLTGAEVDGLAGLRYHRGLSHSLLAAPFLSLPVAVLWWWIRRSLRRRERPDAPHMTTSKPPPPFWMLYLCVLVAVATHPLLDWTTSYGTCLLAPLSEARYALDAAPIIDLIYTPLLVLTLLGCWVARRVSRRPTRATLIVAWTGFLLSCGYLAAGRICHDIAIARAERLLPPGQTVVRTDAYPALGTIFLWRAVIETPAGWHATRIHLFSSAAPESWKTSFAPRQADNEWIDRARRTPEYETYRWFTSGRLRAENERLNGAHVVKFHDMRYAETQWGVESLWPLVVSFGPEGEIVFVGRKRELPRRQFANHASQAWNDLWNP